MPSQPLQPRPAYQQQIPQQAALPNASHQPQYQPQGTHSAWQPSAAQQPRQHAPPHPAPPQLAYSSAPQSTYAQQQQQQYPSLHHAHSQNPVAGRADMPAQSAVHTHQQQGATMQTASAAATQHAQAAAGTPGTSAGRGFTHNQLNVLRNQILAFRRIKVRLAATVHPECLNKPLQYCCCQSLHSQSSVQCHSLSRRLSGSWAAYVADSSLCLCRAAWGQDPTGRSDAGHQGSSCRWLLCACARHWFLACYLSSISSNDTANEASWTGMSP